MCLSMCGYACAYYEDRRVIGFLQLEGIGGLDGEEGFKIHGLIGFVAV